MPKPVNGNNAKPGDVRDHYDKLQQYYVDQYDPTKLDSLPEYAANYFRLEIIRRRLAEKGAKRLLDAGVGSGIPAVRLAEDQSTDDVVGFDYTPEMVSQARKTFSEAGLDPNNVFVGDVRQPEDLERAAGARPFDVALVLGVMPHVEDDAAVLGNVRSVLKDGGRAFVSFRNKLFSLFTMNRFTHAIILDELLTDVPGPIRQAADTKLQEQMEMDKPPLRTSTAEGSLGYDLILSRWHNPLEIDALFVAAGFRSTRLHWYHYHPCAPYLEGAAVSRADFRAAAMALEGESNDWRGHFLCSAFLVEATA